MFNNWAASFFASVFFSSGGIIIARKIKKTAPSGLFANWIYVTMTCTLINAVVVFGEDDLTWSFLLAIPLVSYFSEIFEAPENDSPWVLFMVGFFCAVLCIVITQISGQAMIEMSEYGIHYYIFHIAFFVIILAYAYYAKYCFKLSGLLDSKKG